MPKGYVTKKVQARRRGEANALAREEITAERTMLEIARMAFTLRSGIFKDGNLKPLEEWTEDEASLLEGLEVIIKNAQAGDGHTDVVHKVQLAKKLGALEILAKHFGLLTDKVQMTVTHRLEDLVAGSLMPDDASAAHD